MSIPSPFEVKQQQRQQHLKERPEPPAAEAPAGPARSVGLELESRKRRKQTYTVYLDKALMGRVQRMAKEKGVAVSVVIEACIKMALAQLE